MSRCIPGAMVICALAAISCSEVPSSPQEPFAIAFPPTPWPAVVQGDTLRNANGGVAPLTATVYNADGAVIMGAPVRFFALDTAGLVDVDSATGVLVSTGAARGTVRTFASIGTLQSDVRPITVIPRPDSVQLVSGGDTLFYSYADTTLNVSTPIVVRVLHDSTSTVFLAVDGYLVRYGLADPTDTTVAALIDDQNRRGPTEAHGLISVDTTASGGNASRRIRLHPGPALATPVDSVVVLAYVRYHGMEVRGSPIRVAVPLKQRVVAVTATDLRPVP